MLEDLIEQEAQAAPPTGDPALDAAVAAGTALRDELAGVVRRYVEEGRLEPLVATEAVKALAAQSVAELTGGGHFGLCAAGHVLERYGAALREHHARAAAEGDGEEGAR